MSGSQKDSAVLKGLAGAKNSKEAAKIIGDNLFTGDSEGQKILDTTQFNSMSKTQRTAVLKSLDAAAISIGDDVYKPVTGNVKKEYAQAYANASKNPNNKTTESEFNQLMASNRDAGITQRADAATKSHKFYTWWDLEDDVTDGSDFIDGMDTGGKGENLDDATLKMSNLFSKSQVSPYVQPESPQYKDLQDALSKQDTERVEMHLANFQKDIAVFEGKYNKFDAFVKDTNNFGENTGVLGGRQHGVKIDALPVSAKSADEAAFAIPWIGSRVSNGSKIVGYRSYGTSGSYGVQGSIYKKILEIKEFIY